MSISDLGAANPDGTLNVLAALDRRRGDFSLLAIAALIVIEVLSLTVRFDALSIVPGQSTRAESAGRAPSGLSAADPVSGGRHWLLWTLGHAGVALKMGAAAAAAILFFSGSRLRDEFERLAGRSPWRWSWPALVGHFVTLLIFVWLCGQIFDGPVLASSWFAAWLAAWMASGSAVLALLVATVLPPSLWAPLAWQTIRALSGGLTVGIAALGAGWLTSLFWRPLSRYTLESVHLLLGLATSDLVYEPERFNVGTSQFSVNIAPQCSGYEGIGLIWAFLGAYLWIYRHRLRFPRAWLLLPIGAAAMWLVNAVRITALVAVGTWLSTEIAIGGFHSQAGWLGFIAVALGLLLLMQGTGFFLRHDETQAAPVLRSNPEAVYLAPLMAIVATGMLGAVFSTGEFDRYYPVRLAAVAIPLWLYRRQYAAMQWICSWRALAIGLVVFALWNVPHPSCMVGSARPTARSLDLGNAGAWVWLLARVVGSVVTVPLAEELAFRGCLTRWLISLDFESVPAGRFTWTSFVVSSLAFGLLHGDRWLEGTVAGMLYALAYYRRGSLGDAVAAHATTNALLSAEALITGDWSLWS
jgi:exosortase E/protease (VPEID-CTERM system)